MTDKVTKPTDDAAAFILGKLAEARKYEKESRKYAASARKHEAEARKYHKLAERLRGEGK
jgi:hypothetical protein